MGYKLNKSEYRQRRKSYTRIYAKPDDALVRTDEIIAALERTASEYKLTPDEMERLKYFYNRTGAFRGRVLVYVICALVLACGVFIVSKNSFGPEDFIFLVLLPLIVMPLIVLACITLGRKTALSFLSNIEKGMYVAYRIPVVRKTFYRYEPGTKFFDDWEDLPKEWYYLESDELTICPSIPPDAMLSTLLAGEDALVFSVPKRNGCRKLLILGYGVLSGELLLQT